jgi:hypothetical protein
MSEPRIATVPGITPIVQLGIGDTRQPVPQAGRWDVSHWDSATDAHWAALEPQWLDITCDVHGVDTRLGHERTLDRWEVGTALIDASNATGWADVLAQVDDPALIALRPGRQIRWGARIDATGEVVWRFRGYIDTHSATYRGLHLDLDAAQLSCIDALGEVGRVQLGRLVAPVGAGESMTARVHRILDAAAWHADRRAIAAVPVAMIGTDLNGQAIDLLGQAADSGSCALYGDYSGRVALRERDWQTWLSSAPPDATIGNSAGEVCPSSIEVSFPRAGATTRALVNYAEATTPPVQRDDLAAQDAYGVETDPERLDLMTSDAAQLGRVADDLLRAQGTSTMPRVSAVELNAGRDAATLDAVLRADPQRPSRWRVHLVRGGRVVVDRMMLVTNVEHAWDAEGWRCRVGLDDAEPWRAIGGKWDQASWDQALWQGELVGA